ncbi:Uncharacterized protein HA466_0111560 [Hirschfeldia incana]|nr:Uncharacterized protein HA466_0111560 [Hirschfeldia incana]
MTDGDWTREAMSDDSLVAEALISLHHVEPPPPPEKSGVLDLKLKWSVRQRRSKATPPSRKKGEHTRDSPSTPLSWSGATSLSGGGGGGGSGVAAVEESSCAVKLSVAVRSKISQTSVTPTIPFKRSRKKKTLAELKEEESLLLKEKKGLKNELASMQNLLKQQKVRNESLKKIQAATETQKKDDSSFLLPDLNIPLDNNNPS